ncbi:hypothetical protein [Victivallis vadensis]|uniref:hypothetical protein n=1 Tax=Victivallis vadensis TaxID=172901 RepID=UPI00307D8FD8
MFWTQCDKIVTSGGPVKCDFCPCPKYIYVTRCDKTENDFDDCDCNPETAWERARLVTYFASENGCINVAGAWRRLNHTYYPADDSGFSANGSVYKAIETGENGPKTYDTRQKAQTEWDAHPKSHWGEKVIAACTCCCTLEAEVNVEVTYTCHEYWLYTNESTGAVWGEQRWDTTVTAMGTCIATNTVSISDLSGTFHSKNWWDYCTGPEPGSCWDDTCTGSCTDYPLIVRFNLSDDCKYWKVASYTLPRPNLSNDSELCKWFGGGYEQALEWTKSERNGSYLSGTWTGTYNWEDINPIENRGISYTMTVTVTPTNKTNHLQSIPTTYMETFNSLSRDLQHDIQI